MPAYRVYLGFAKLPDADLSQFARLVLNGLTGNPAFPHPAVPLADLAAAQVSFAEALIASNQGGMQTTAVKNAARQALIGLLRLEAYYVQVAMKDDLAVLLSSGFEAASNNRTPSPLSAPVILRIRNEQSTQLALDLQRVDNARAYEVQKMNGTGEWTVAGTFTKARGVVLENLVPGSVYKIQVRAIGGSTGYSPWSNPVSHMSM